MSRGEHHTVYRRSGFGSLVYGVCGVMGVGLLCAAGVGLYGLSIVDRKIDNVFALGTGVLHSLPEIRESLPPIVSDLLEDTRAPEYRDQIQVTAKVLPCENDRWGTRVLVEATNSGPDMVTLLAVRVNLEDSEGQFLRAENAYVATPLAGEGELAGPILAGATRRHVVRLSRCNGPVSPSIEICDIRIWPKSDAFAGL